MNFVEEFLEAVINFLVAAANELSNLFVETVRRTIRAIRSIWIIGLFFTALVLGSFCFLGMCLADHHWVIRATGGLLLVFTLMTLLAAFLRVRSATHGSQKKQEMGIPLVLVNILFLIGNYAAWAEHPLTPINYLGLADSHVSHASKPPLPAQQAIQDSGRGAKPEPARINVASLNSTHPKTTTVEESTRPTELPNCTAHATADYMPVMVLAKVQSARPANSGDTGGEVELKGKVDRYGRTRDLMVSNSTLPPEFGDEAIRAVNQWVFNPAQSGGEPTPCELKITVEFQADKQ
jgi:TonB family protein